MTDTPTTPPADDVLAKGIAKLNELRYASEQESECELQVRLGNDVMMHTHMRKDFFDWKLRAMREVIDLTPALVAALEGAQARIAALEAYEAEWRPKMLETVYVPGYETRLTVIDIEGEHYRCESVDGGVTGLFLANELAPDGEPAIAVAQKPTDAREPEPIAEFEAWVERIEGIDSFMKLHCETPKDDEQLVSVVQKYRNTDKKVRVVIYAIADAAAGEQERC